MKEAKEVKVAKFKDSISYRMAIGYAIIEFLIKEKIKMRRLPERAYNIKDLSCLENIDLEPTFSGSYGVKKKKEKR